MSDDFMSDELRIPTPGLDTRAPLSSGYRARREEPDAFRKYIIMGMAGFGGLVLVGIASWAVMGRHATTIPVIEADSRPIRVKPENPGGMQVTGADEQDGAEKMAPPPETPAPQALRAQMLQAAAPATPPATPPASTPPASTPPANAPPASAPAASTPPANASPAIASATSTPAANVPAAASPFLNAPPVLSAPRVTAAPPPARISPPNAATPTTTPPAHPAAAGTVVQLAAVETEAAAQAEWQRITKKWPDLLASHKPSIQKAERDGKTFWRVRTGGFADIADATTFCTRLRGKGAGCTIASF